jgi:hypothetical protein
MYGAGYSVRPFAAHRPRPLLAGVRWLAVFMLILLAGAALAVVAHGGTPHAGSTVVVQPGDTLWSIAANRYPADDVRVRVEDIERANNLSGPVIQVGETLLLPG